ncbi:MAG: GNAT family N-acetyltransferase [Maritimibacter sp.]
MNTPPAPRITTRKAKALDAPGIELLHALNHEQHKLMFENYDGVLFAAPWLKALKRSSGITGVFQKFSKPSKHIAFVAHHEGEFAGHLLGSVEIAAGNIPVFFINDISVAADFRRQGVGSKLIHAGETGAQQLGLRVFATGIWRGHTASEALFANAGYRSWPQLDAAGKPNIGHYIRSLTP